MPFPSISGSASFEQLWLTQLQQQQVIAVIRASQVEQGIKMAQAAAQGGIQLIEITWNSAEPVTLLRQVQQALPDCQIGVGTLLSVADLESAIANNAHFCFSPIVSLAMLEAAQAAQIPIIPGAMTPTEIVTAWQAGATAIKVFPISSLGGAAYLRNLQGPLGQIPLIPTGGIDLALAPQLLKAGATAIALSSALFPPQDMAAQRWQMITQRCQRLRALLETCNGYQFEPRSPDWEGS